jgi:hypothetical protein
MKPRQIFSNQQLRGVVSVVTARDRVEGTDFFQVQHVSAGGDVVWTSPPILCPDQADCAARTLAAFVGGEVRR